MVNEMPKEIVETPMVPQPDATYSNATVGGGFIFVAGQIGIDSKGEVKVGIAEQTRQALNNIRNIIEAAGSSLENVLRVGVCLCDLKDFDEMDKIYRTFFPRNPPARITMQTLIGDKRAVIEIEAIALKE
jgi:2-iminobutanoate/2-iminopropanoate deaminase